MDIHKKIMYEIHFEASLKKNPCINNQARPEVKKDDLINGGAVKPHPITYSRPPPPPCISHHIHPDRTGSDVHILNPFKAMGATWHRWTHPTDC